jgi:hypothetical protein
MSCCAQFNSRAIVHYIMAEGVGRGGELQEQMEFKPVKPKTLPSNNHPDANPQSVDLYVLDHCGHPQVAKSPSTEQVISAIQTFNRSFSGLEDEQIDGDKSSALSLM